MSHLIRPMREDDLDACEVITRDAYFLVDQETYQRGWIEPAPRAEAARPEWLAKSRHKLATDPGGCWVAESDGEIVGVATSLRRDLLWILCSFAVRPEVQGRGVGAQLLQAVLEYGAGCLRGMFVASQDQGALRRYRQAGFDLQPLLMAWGTVDRSLLPAGLQHLREGSASDFSLCDSLDRRTRGAAHGPDHALLSQQYRLIVTDHSTGQGYAYLGESGGVQCLAADSRGTARALMWEGLASAQPGVPVEMGRISATNDWALDVAIEARLEIHTRNYLATRRMNAPAAYVPHSTFL